MRVFTRFSWLYGCGRGQRRKTRGQGTGNRKARWWRVVVSHPSTMKLWKDGAPSGHGQVKVGAPGRNICVTRKRPFEVQGFPGAQMRGTWATRLQWLCSLLPAPGAPIFYGCARCSRHPGPTRPSYPCRTLHARFFRAHASRLTPRVARLNFYVRCTWKSILKHGRSLRFS